VNPQLKAINTARTEPTTEALAFTAHAHGMALSRLRLNFRTPLGKNIPIMNPKGKITKNAMPWRIQRGHAMARINTRSNMKAYARSNTGVMRRRVWVAVVVTFLE
jgi:hypothetical protein